MEKFLSEQLKRNIANHIAIEKAMGRNVTDEQCLDILEKGGKRAQLGDVRTWNGKEYIKTPKGWRPKPKGYKEAKESDESLIDMINRKLKEGHAAVKDSMKDDAKKIMEQHKTAKRSPRRVNKEHTGSESKPVMDSSRPPESITDELSEIFFNRKTTPGKITAFVDKYLGTGATARIWDGLNKRTFDSSTDKDNAFIEKFYDLLSDKMWNEKKQRNEQVQSKKENHDHENSAGSTPVYDGPRIRLDRSDFGLENILNNTKGGKLLVRQSDIIGGGLVALEDALIGSGWNLSSSKNEKGKYEAGGKYILFYKK